MNDINNLLALALVWPWLAVLVSVCLSVAHALEECCGDGGPLWEYFARVAESRPLPEHLSLLVVGGLLPGVLCVVAGAGYLYQNPWWLSLLAGARLTDAVTSHWLPWLLAPGQGRPNPGQWSAIAYLFEGSLILALSGVEWLPLALGGLPFLLVWPVLWLLPKK